MKLILSNDQSQYAEIEGSVHQLTTAERLKYSVRKFIFLFFLAVASVFIPVFHFVLVPLFLLLAVIMAFKSYKVLLRFEFKKPSLCLKCQKELPSSYFLNQNLKIKCATCFSHYLIDVSDIFNMQKGKTISL